MFWGEDAKCIHCIVGVLHHISLGRMLVRMLRESALSAILSPLRLCSNSLISSFSGSPRGNQKLTRHVLEESAFHSGHKEKKNKQG